MEGLKILENEKSKMTEMPCWKYELEADTEYVKMKGTPTIRLLDMANGGQVIKEYTNHNLIVKIGRSAIVKMLAGSLTNIKVAKCALGTQGVNALVDPWLPIAPIDSEIALKHEVGIRKDVAFTMDTATPPTYVVFTTLFSSSDINDIVSEAGLFLTDGTTMLARYTFPSMYLRNDKGYALEISWKIQF